MLARMLAAVVALVLATAASAQDVPLEYRVKAAYLFNFTKFIDWPAGSMDDGAPLVICVAGANPFGTALDETIRGELVGGRALEARVVREPSGCNVLFVPKGVPPAGLLREARTKPILTVGESTDFLHEGGVVNFFMEDGKVRFEIGQDAASRAQLRISSRLMRLARVADTR
jgi:hypothetical protein